MFCLRMVEAANAPRPTAATRTTTAQVNRARPGSKAYTVGQLMLRREGVTAAEAIAATGWPSISLPQQATACGLTYTTQRIGRTVRYFANAAAANAAAGMAEAITFDSLMDTIGAEPAERLYFRHRITNLSGPVAWAA